MYGPRRMEVRASWPASISVGAPSQRLWCQLGIPALTQAPYWARPKIAGARFEKQIIHELFQIWKIVPRFWKQILQIKNKYKKFHEIWK